MEGKERIDVSSLSEQEFGVSEVKTIEQSELQSFLMNDPIPNDGEQEPEKVKNKEVDTPPTTQTKDKPKKQPEPTGDEVDEYLLDEEDEDEDTPPAKQEDKPKAEKKPKEEEDEPIFTTLARDLKKAGIFTDDEEDEGEITDAKSFKDKFIREMYKGANSIVSQLLSQHGPEYQDAFEDAFEAIIVKGVKPSTYFLAQERIEDLKSIDLTKEINQEQIMRNYFKTNYPQYSDEKISARIQRFKDMGTLEEEATDAHELMLKSEEARDQEEQMFAEEQAAIRAQNKHNYRTAMQGLINDKLKNKNFDGIPLSPSIATKVYNDLTVEAWRVGDMKITEFDKKIMDLNRPENFEKKFKLALLLNDDLDLSHVKREAIKTEKEELFEGLERKKAKKQIPTAPQMKSFFPQ